MTYLFVNTVTYTATAIQMFLGEANFVATQVNLPTPHPITASDFTEMFVTPERFGLGGSIRVTNVLFTRNQGRLHTCGRLDGRTVGSDRFYKDLRNQRSLLDHHGAYLLATQWLAAIGLNVPALETNCIRRIEQQWMLGASHRTASRVPILLSAKNISRCST